MKAKSKPVVVEAPAEGPSVMFLCTANVCRSPFMASVFAEAAHRDSRIRMVTHPANLGYSAALAHGFAACRYEAIFYTDSDAQFDFEDLRRAWPLLAEADMVAGWRRDRQDSRLRPDPE